VTSPKVVEGFSSFSVKEGDVFCGDRGYPTAKDIFYASQNGGHAIVRMISILPLFSRPTSALKYCLSFASWRWGNG
jgi:hypothetical protein